MDKISDKCSDMFWFPGFLFKKKKQENDTQQLSFILATSHFATALVLAGGGTFEVTINVSFK